MTFESFGEPHFYGDGELLQLTFTPNGDLLTVEDPGILRRWDVRTARQRECLTLSDLETLWCFSTDARVLASGSDDLTIWDASDGRAITSIPQKSWVTAVGFAPDATLVATGHDDGSLNFWFAAGGHREFGKSLTHHKEAISAVAVSPDCKLLAAASEDRTISLWDLADGRHLGTLAGHTDRISALAFDPSDPGVLVSAGWDTTARVWNARTLEPIILLNTHAMQVTALAFSADGSRLACADSSLTVHLWDFKARKTLHKLKGAEAEIFALAFSRDGKHLAAVAGRAIPIWDTTTGQAVTGAGSAPVSRTSLAVSPDGNRFATNGGGVAPRVWDAAQRRVAVTLEGGDAVHEIAYSPDGKRIAGAAGKVVRIWDAATGKVLREWEGPHEPITTLAFSRDGQKLAAAARTSTEVWLWNTADGEAILLIPDALDGCAIESLAFHPNGKLLAIGGVDVLATGGSDGAVCLWDLENRCEITTVPDGSTAVAFNPSGDRLACSTLTQSICIWDGALQKLLTELLGHDGPVTCLAYGADGRYLASASDDRTVRLWDEGGKERAMQEVESQVTGLAFAPDGLFTAHANTTCGKLALADLVS